MSFTIFLRENKSTKLNESEMGDIVQDIISVIEYVMEKPGYSRQAVGLLCNMFAVYGSEYYDHVLEGFDDYSELSDALFGMTYDEIKKILDKQHPCVAFDLLYNHEAEDYKKLSVKEYNSLLDNILKELSK